MSTPSSTIPCDLAITNGQVLTLGEACKVYEPGLVLIHNHRIVYVGFDGKRAPDYQAKEKLDAGGSIVMPTFLNGHNHAGMSLYRGLGNDLDLDEWLNRVVWPLETKHCTAPNVYLGTMLSAIEMIRSGVSFFADMYFFQDEVATVCEELGMRVILGEGVLDFPTPNSKTPEECLKYTERLTQKYHQHPLIGISVPAHAPYSCTPEVLREVAELASRLNIPATIHLAETQKEFSTYQQQYGKTPTQYIADLGFLEGRAVAYHCNWLTDEDRTILQRSGTGVITITHSNMKLASGICPVSDLLSRGIPVGIGTDGPMSNNNLSMLLDLRTTALLHKIHEKNPKVLPTEEVLRMATLNVAKAYGLEQDLGSLEVGKLADLMIVDTDQAHWQPLHDPHAGIVYTMHPGDVKTVIIHGKVVMKNRRLPQIDESQFIARMKELRNKLG